MYCASRCHSVLDLCDIPKDIFTESHIKAIEHEHVTFLEARVIVANRVMYNDHQLQLCNFFFYQNVTKTALFFYVCIGVKTFFCYVHSCLQLMVAVDSLLVYSLLRNCYLKSGFVTKPFRRILVEKSS
jgi:hypothetical protein